MGCVLYRALLRQVKLRKRQAGLKWAGDLGLQVCAIAFTGFKRWFLQKKERETLNHKAMERWRKKVLRRAVLGWRDARAQRLNDGEIISLS